MAKTSGGYGLLLTLPGAPIEAAQVHDGSLNPLPGFYHPLLPTPVGEPGDPLTIEAATAAHNDDACHLELVQIPPGDREFLTAVHAGFVAKFRGGTADWDAINALKSNPTPAPAAATEED